MIKLYQVVSNGIIIAAGVGIGIARQLRVAQIRKGKKAIVSPWGIGSHPK